MAEGDSSDRAGGPSHGRFCGGAAISSSTSSAVKGAAVSSSRERAAGTVAREGAEAERDGVEASAFAVARLLVDAAEADAVFVPGLDLEGVSGLLGDFATALGVGLVLVVGVAVREAASRFGAGGAGLVALAVVGAVVFLAEAVAVVEAVGLAAAGFLGAVAEEGSGLAGVFLAGAGDVAAVLPDSFFVAGALGAGGAALTGLDAAGEADFDDATGIAFGMALAGVWRAAWLDCALSGVVTKAAANPHPSPRVKKPYSKAIKAIYFGKLKFQ